MVTKVSFLQNNDRLLRNQTQTRQGKISGEKTSMDIQRCADG